MSEKSEQILGILQYHEIGGVIARWGEADPASVTDGTVNGSVCAHSPGQDGRRPHESHRSLSQDSRGHRGKGVVCPLRFSKGSGHKEPLETPQLQVKARCEC